MSEECSFSFVSLSNSDVVITPTDVYHCELGASAEVVHHLGNEGEYISILLCPFVDGSVILYWL